MTTADVTGSAPLPLLRPATLPPEVGACMATRVGGVSTGAFAALNLRPACLPGAELDAPEAVAENQRRFTAALEGAQPVWLDQVHGAAVHRLVRADVGRPGPLTQADASFTTERGLACTVLVADCLPVLIAAPHGRAVGAAHAGWRGLAGGVVEASLQAVCAAAACEPAALRVWLGACIGPQAFEVGPDVHAAFAGAPEALFRPGRPGKFMADLPGLARWRLAQAGVQQVEVQGGCTFSDASTFFSFRRDRVTGRHAAAIWIR